MSREQNLYMVHAIGMVLANTKTRVSYRVQYGMVGLNTIREVGRQTCLAEGWDWLKILEEIPQLT